jgi:hypothetical protein
MNSDIIKPTALPDKVRQYQSDIISLIVTFANQINFNIGVLHSIPIDTGHIELKLPELYVVTQHIDQQQQLIISGWLNRFKSNGVNLDRLITPEEITQFISNNRQIDIYNVIKEIYECPGPLLHSASFKKYLKYKNKYLNKKSYI